MAPVLSGYCSGMSALLELVAVEYSAFAVSALNSVVVGESCFAGEYSRWEID